MDKGKGILYEDDTAANNPGESSEEYVRVVTLADYEDEPISSWDWREYPGVLGPIVDQVCQAICWAVALVRTVQALFNIGVRLEQQLELSIQHIVNQVKTSGLNDIEDADIEEMVRRQPVLALIPFTEALLDYNYRENWLYRHDRTQDSDSPILHNVIIVGYGDRHGRPYWIVQNSWGANWGDGGYAYVYRQPVRGRSQSQFAAVIYPNKRGYPKDSEPKN
ncbi:unnamed protein product [Thlaspi arvense]|uniref:Peptidase C1A papain C-terminal domain-containing protein n=1 Tax=Thlaspi arvense TaxID=13288 RepID=A0AAU9SRT7_THLAR|nr:unnamed protein product [Thlaspi arvense]